MVLAPPIEHAPSISANPAPVIKLAWATPLIKLELRLGSCIACENEKFTHKIHAIIRKIFMDQSLSILTLEAYQLAFTRAILSTHQKMALCLLKI